MLRKALLTALYAGLGAATTLANRLEEMAPPAAAEAPAEPSRSMPSSPQPQRSEGGQPWAVLGAAFVGGYVLAKVLDWRGNAHSRD
jgi:hypothetical protein